MSGPIVRRAGILFLTFLCAYVDSPLVAQANPSEPPDDPATMQGFLRYKVRGLSGGAGAGPVLAMLLGPVYMEAFLHRVPAGFMKILQGAAKLSGNASNAEIHNLFRSSGAPVDLSTFPVVSGSDAEIEFILERVKRDEYRLKRGSFRWSGETQASISGGDAHVTDRFRGQANGALDPKLSSITLVTTGKKGARQAELDVNVQFPTQIVGEETYRWGPVLTLVTRFKGDRKTTEITTAFGPTHREVDDDVPSGAGIFFTKRGSPETIRKGLEIFQDLLDSGVTAEWEIWGECSAAIRIPLRNDDLIFDDRKPGELAHRALAEVKPSFWEDDLHWEFEEIDGSELDTPPEKANGNDFPITYTKLPAANSAFKFGEVKARFDTERAERAGCKDPEPRSVGYFFLRDAVNHGGARGLKATGVPDDKPNPNWLHYWMQTKASVGLSSDFVRYAGAAGSCDALSQGYYDDGDKHINVCDGIDFKHNPLAPMLFREGIDAFAATLLHEKEHHDLYWRWWPLGYGIHPKLRREPVLDSDNDHIPDLLESSLPVPPQVRSKTGRTRFSPNAWDSFGYEISDEHVLAYAAEFGWRDGSAKSEDWSCPGQQSRMPWRC